MKNSIMYPIPTILYTQNDFKNETENKNLQPNYICRIDQANNVSDNSDSKRKNVTKQVYTYICEIVEQNDCL